MLGFFQRNNLSNWQKVYIGKWHTAKTLKLYNYRANIECRYKSKNLCISKKINLKNGVAIFRDVQFYIKNSEKVLKKSH